MRIDPALIRRYEQRAPRYTSYPPAPHFHEEYGAAEFVEDLGTQAEGADRPLSLYLHLPFCRQLCYYCGCHMKVTSRPETVRTYLDVLKQEIDQTARLVDSDRPVVQVHWGGGTPTYLSPEQIEEVGTHLRSRFAVAPDAEWGIEADPRGLTREHLEAARNVGANRLSLGVQDFDRKVQEAINRVQPKELTDRAVRWSRELGYESLNLDLVYGLPHQDVDSFGRTLEAVRALSPDRVALFSYAHVPSIMQHQQLIPDAALPEPEEKLELFTSAVEDLTERGRYRYIGLDHFALPEDELARAQEEGTLWRNFQGYSTRADADVLAFGISGIHQLAGAYAQNEKGLKEYYAAVRGERSSGHSSAGRDGAGSGDRGARRPSAPAGAPPVYRGYRLSRDDRIRRRCIMQLMCNLELEKSEIESAFGLSFDRYFSETLERLRRLEEDGLVDLEDEAIRVPERAKPLLRTVVMNFDRYLWAEREQEEQPAYSSTV